MTHDVFAAALVLFVAVMILLGLMIAFRRLRAAGAAWSIADALSEDVELATDVKDANNLPLRNANGDIARSVVMKASSSRLIALLGLIAIMMLYIGIGLTLIYDFAASTAVPSGIKDITTFLLYGVVMFAPYLVNKFASIFEWMK
eukprot:gene68434-93776_t